MRDLATIFSSIGRANDCPSLIHLDELNLGR